MASGWGLVLPMSWLRCRSSHQPPATSHYSDPQGASATGIRG